MYKQQTSTKATNKGRKVKPLTQGVQRGSLFGLLTPRHTTLRVRLGLEGPKRGWKEQGKKKEGMEERKDQSNGNKG